MVTHGNKWDQQVFKDKPQRHVVLTVEVALEINEDLQSAIKDTLEACRGLAAARVVSSYVLDDEFAYGVWYSKPSLSEIEIPEVTITKIEFD